jgi:hypothetical protein
MNPRFSFVAAALVLAPSIALAQGFDPSYFTFFFFRLKMLIEDILVPLLLALALLCFVWGAIKYFIWSAGNDKVREEGRLFMVYGILGLVAIIGVWGLVNLILVIFGLDGPSNAPALPALP